MSTNTIPIFIFTGFLGSGKTTLLSRLLHEGTLHNTALIINEFGDVGIDHLLLESSGEEIVELSNGCLCCTLRGEIVDTLLNFSHHKNLERIIIETTGLCDPAPLLQIILSHPELILHFHFQTLITALDSVCGYKNLDCHQEAIKQVSLSDILLLTKTDIQPLAPSLSERLHHLNPHAVVVVAQDQNTLSDILLTADNSSSSVNNRSTPCDSIEESHPLSIRSFTLRSKTPIEISRLSRFIDLFHHAGLLRIKGIMNIYDPDKSTDSYPCIIQGVQGVFSPPVYPDTWSGSVPESRLVIIAYSHYGVEIEKLFNALLNNTAIDTPDFEALDNNPLSISNWSAS